MPHRFIARKIKNFFIYRVLHVDDTPHRIALGVAIGMFVTWTPTIGFQMALVVALSWLIGGNKLVGVPFVWISNPFTLFPIYAPSYALGRYLLGGDWPDVNFSSFYISGSFLQRVQGWWQQTYSILAPLWLGSIIVGLAIAVVSYVAIYFTVIEYKKAVKYLHEHHDHKHPAKQHPTAPEKNEKADTNQTAQATTAEQTSNIQSR